MNIAQTAMPHFLCKKGTVKKNCTGFVEAVGKYSLIQQSIQKMIWYGYATGVKLFFMLSQALLQIEVNGNARNVDIHIELMRVKHMLQKMNIRLV